MTDRQTDGRTDGIAVAYTRYSIYAVARKKRFTTMTKSKEFNCDLFIGSASSPFIKIGTRLVFMKWIATSCEAMHPTLPKILLAA